MSDERQLPADLVLGLYGEDTPCVFQLTDPSCDEKAKWMIKIVHQDDETRMCGPESLEFAPFCDGHKKLMERTYVGFWADLVPAPLCLGCERPTSLGEVKPL